MAFAVSFTRNDDNVAQGNKLILRKVSFNDNDNYDTASGVFTCPVQGVYLFSFFFNSQHDVSFGIYKDNVEMVRASNADKNSANDWGSGHGLTICYCAAGSNVSVEPVFIEVSPVEMGRHRYDTGIAGGLLYASSAEESTRMVRCAFVLKFNV